MCSFYRNRTHEGLCGNLKGQERCFDQIGALSARHSQDVNLWSSQKLSARKRRTRNRNPVCVIHKLEMETQDERTFQLESLTKHLKNQDSCHRDGFRKGKAFETIGRRHSPVRCWCNSLEGKKRTLLRKWRKMTKQQKMRGINIHTRRNVYREVLIV